jgi:hypothetical protein
MLAAFPCPALLVRQENRSWFHVAALTVSVLVLLVLTQYFIRGAVIL